MATSTATTTWPDLAIGLYDKLTGRGAEINYEFKDFQLGIPSAVGASEQATWKLNGALKISTRDHAG